MDIEAFVTEDVTQEVISGMTSVITMLVKLTEMTMTMKYV